MLRRRAGIGDIGDVREGIVLRRCAMVSVASFTTRAINSKCWVTQLKKLVGLETICESEYLPVPASFNSMC